MPLFKVPVKYTFEGYYLIEADTHKKAMEHAKKHCGMICGPIQSTLPDTDVDWEFPVHPQSEIDIPEKQ